MKNLKLFNKIHPSSNKNCKGIKSDKPKKFRSTKAVQKRHEKSTLCTSANPKTEVARSADSNLDNIVPDAFESITRYLSSDDLIELLFVCTTILGFIKNSVTILLRLHLMINKINLERLTLHTPLHLVPFKNISIDFKGFSCLAKPLKFLGNFLGSVENLHVKNAKFSTYEQFAIAFGSLKSIKTLKFENCVLEQYGSESIAVISTLHTMTFISCNVNIFKVMKNQFLISKIEVINPIWTWNGFPHDTFNEICKKCQKLQQIKLIGSGTGSYFDSDDFPYKIKKLETSMVTFHWYVGIRTERVDFLRSQIGQLKDLTIHQLPNDFDGGRVMKFIFTEMKLDNFHYGKIPLIVNGKKQEVKEFAATEIQIRASMELMQQYPSIESYTLILSSTDIASDEIEKAINPRNDLFKQIKKFEVIDNSGYRGLFGVFLGLLKNLTNLKILSLKTQDRNVNVLLQESLPCMTKLEEIYMTSMASSKYKERLAIIKRKCPTLRKLSVAEQFVGDAKIVFGKSVEVFGIP
ncbi:uncharacterized protein [Chironomus tepperi]|uniref:uncharacterized protein n=1 Tax=Chironomus tepperi TaxID=113505 RepID=UPI00391F812A